MNIFKWWWEWARYRHRMWRLHHIRQHYHQHDWWQPHWWHRPHWRQWLTGGKRGMAASLTAFDEAMRRSRTYRRLVARHVIYSNALNAITKGSAPGGGQAHER